jgi:hypothetical protein
MKRFTVVEVDIESWSPECGPRTDETWYTVYIVLDDHTRIHMKRTQEENVASAYANVARKRYGLTYEPLDGVSLDVQITARKRIWALEREAFQKEAI